MELAHVAKQPTERYIQIASKQHLSEEETMKIVSLGQAKLHEEWEERRVRLAKRNASKGQESYAYVF
jgi:hypothetical protein